MLSGVSFDVPSKDVIKLVKRGNTKGDAAVGSVLKLVGGSDKGVAILNRSVSAFSYTIGRGVNIIFSKDGFSRRLAPTGLDGMLQSVCSS